MDATLLVDHGGQYRAYVQADRTTLDAHLTTARFGALPLHAEVEGAVQSGHQQLAATGASQQISAWLAAGRLIATLLPFRRATLGVGVDMLSGDATPTDGRYTAFSTMYATNHPFYGLMDVIGDPATTTKDRGLTDALGTGAIALSSMSTLRAELHQFTLATGANRALGWESDVVIPTRLNRAATINVGYSRFQSGDGAAAIGLGLRGAVRNWVYLQLGVAF